MVWVWGAGDKSKSSTAWRSGTRFSSGLRRRRLTEVRQTGIDPSQTSSRDRNARGQQEKIKSVAGPATIKDIPPFHTKGTALFFAEKPRMSGNAPTRTTSQLPPASLRDSLDALQQRADDLHDLGSALVVVQEGLEFGHVGALPVQPSPATDLKCQWRAV